MLSACVIFEELNLVQVLINMRRRGFIKYILAVKNCKLHFYSKYVIKKAKLLVEMQKAVLALSLFFTQNKL
jgi:hypothetical protein